MNRRCCSSNASTCRCIRPAKCQPESKNGHSCLSIVSMLITRSTELWLENMNKHACLSIVSMVTIQVSSSESLQLAGQERFTGFLGPFV